MAVASRLLVLLVQLIASAVFAEHDADAFRIIGFKPKTRADRIAHCLLGGLSRWDAQHFLHVANDGYQLESELAFFPLFPLLIRLGASASAPLLSSVLALSPLYQLLVVATLLNLALFVACAVVLWHLAQAIAHEQFGATRRRDCNRIAKGAVLLFCVNPASIFFTAAYSESLFALLSFGGLYLGAYRRRLFAGAFLFLLSGLCRSNGVLNSLLLLGSMLGAGGATTLAAAFYSAFKSVRNLVYSMALLAGVALLLVLPFAGALLFQAFAWHSFCGGGADRQSTLMDDDALKSYAVPIRGTFQPEW